MAAEHLTKGRGVFLLWIIALGVGVIGWGSPAPTSLPCDGTFHTGFGRCEEGSTSCSMGGNALCSPSTVVYPVAFTNAVTRSDITLTMNRIGTSSQIVTGQQSYAAWSFLHIETAGQTWTNMPAAQTEFFGDALGQHRITADWGNMTQVDFIVDCSVGSASATAKLDVQYSPDLGTTWTTVPGISVLVSNTLCGLGIPLDWGDTTATCSNTSGTGCYQPIPVGARVQGVLLRVVGTNGNGVGDLPVFQQAYVMTHTASSTVTFGLSCSPAADPSIVPKVSFQITVYCSFANSVTVTIAWKAWVSAG